MKHIFLALGLCLFALTGSIVHAAALAAPTSLTVSADDRAVKPY